jgi:hypothetical protein
MVDEVDGITMAFLVAAILFAIACLCLVYLQ